MQSGCLENWWCQCEVGDANWIMRTSRSLRNTDIWHASMTGKLQIAPGAEEEEEEREALFKKYLRGFLCWEFSISIRYINTHALIVIESRLPRFSSSRSRKVKWARESRNFHFSCQRWRRRNMRCRLSLSLSPPLPAACQLYTRPLGLPTSLHTHFFNRLESLFHLSASRTHLFWYKTPTVSRSLTCLCASLSAEYWDQDADLRRLVRLLFCVSSYIGLDWLQRLSFTACYWSFLIAFLLLLLNLP